MPAATDLRLPGVYFLPPLRAAGLGLPRLDVAAFVGFAERGPLHLPVPLEDLKTYREIFGEELPLAREPGGQTVYANLPRAVAGFFANGGRRCYVVRVAGREATPTRFRIPGLVALDKSGEANPVSISASSPGGWAGKLRLGTRWQITPLPWERFKVKDQRCLTWETGSAPQAILPGDLLRLTFVDESQWLFPVTAVQRLPTTPREAEVVAEGIWQLPTLAGSPPAAANLLDLPFPSPTLPSSALWRVERLRFDLLLREGDKRRPTLTQLAFNTGHPRFWGEVVLLESSILYRQSSADADGRRAAHAARLFREMQQDTRSEEARNGRLDVVALAGLLAPVGEDATLTYLPLGMSAVVMDDDELAGPVSVGDDDLATFASDLFLDQYLVPDPRNIATAESARTLMAAAFDRYYLQNRRLHGLHSLLFIDEVALVSVPDAVHRGWTLEVAESPPAPPPPVSSPPLPPLPDWSRFMDCELPPAAESSLPGEPPQPTDPPLPTLKPVGEFDNKPLLEIHHALINFCQARGDVVGILTLPLHFEKRQCIGWQEDLRQRLGLPRRRSVFDDVRDIADLSYVAVYHPWLLVADASAPDRLRPVPCEGVVCGMIAARERQRQAWVAPANVPLQGVLGLMPPFSTG
jgi:hypothetical protein